ncbi:MAG: cytochrome c [Gemmatimonadota bacterium]|nr:cytochrome c [Gemmatimonadota bacterium]
MSRARLARLAIVVAVAASAGACEWFSTMSDPAAVQPHERQPWAPPEGSIPLDGYPEYTLADVEGLLTNPVDADSASEAIGEAYYRTYCSVCHGDTGLGNGPISDIFPAIPAIATGKVAGMTDAYLYALITQGRGLMPEYSRIPKTARWHVVNYMRTMGTAADTTAADGGTATADTAAGDADTTAARATASGGSR